MLVILFAVGCILQEPIIIDFQLEFEPKTNNFPDKDYKLSHSMPVLNRTIVCLLDTF